MKLQKMSKVVAEQEISKQPSRIKGQWKATLEELTKDGQGAKISELTRGQTAALIREAKTQGFIAVACDKYTSVILSPPNAKNPKTAPIEKKA